MVSACPRYLRTEGRAWYILPCVWIMTAGFTGRCHRDEECHALAHETKRGMMGRGSYDNNDKLGLTGQHDDGSPAEIATCCLPTADSARLEEGWSLGVWWQTHKSFTPIWCLSNSQLNNIKGIVIMWAHRVSIRGKKKHKTKSRVKCLLPPRLPLTAGGGGS